MLSNVREFLNDKFEFHNIQETYFAQEYQFTRKGHKHWEEGRWKPSTFTASLLSFKKWKEAYEISSLSVSINKFCTGRFL